MKKIISVVLCMCLMIGFLVGCSEEKSMFDSGVEKFISEFTKLNEDLGDLGGRILKIGIDESDAEYNLHDYLVSYYDFPSTSIVFETSKDNETIANISADTDIKDKELVNIPFSLTVNLIASVLDSECDLEEFDRIMEVVSLGKIPKEGITQEFDEFICYAYETTQKKIFLFEAI